MSNQTATVPELDVVRRLLEPDVLADPAAFYTWVRDNVRVHLHPQGFYLLSRYHDARWMFQSPLLRGPEPAEYADRYPRLVRYRSVQVLLGTIANMSLP